MGDVVRLCDMGIWDCVIWDGELGIAKVTRELIISIFDWAWSCEICNFSLFNYNYESQTLWLKDFHLFHIQSGGFSANISSGDSGAPSGPAYLRWEGCQAAYLRLSKLSLSTDFHFPLTFTFFHSFASLGFLVSGIILAWSCAGLTGKHLLATHNFKTFV